MTLSSKLTKEQLAVATFIFFCFVLISAGTYLNLQRYAMYEEEMFLTELRFAEAKQYLPPKGIVGYLTGEKSENVGSIFYYRVTMEYFMIRYVLAPLIVESGVPEQSQFVIGNYSDRIPDHSSQKLKVKFKFPNGVLILEKSKY